MLQAMLPAGTVIETADDGEIFANGMPLTTEGPWLPLPLGELIAGAPDGVAARVTVRDAGPAENHVVLFVEEVRVGWMRYAGIHSLAAIEGEAWVACLEHALRIAVERRLRAAASGAERPRRYSGPRAAMRPLTAADAADAYLTEVRGAAATGPRGNK